VSVANGNVSSNASVGSSSGTDKATPPSTLGGIQPMISNAKMIKKNLNHMQAMPVPEVVS
jgi:hypothetical protein